MKLIAKKDLKSLQRYNQFWDDIREHKKGEYVRWDDLIELFK